MKLICLQVEVCHANKDGVAWYGYFKDEPTGIYHKIPNNHRMLDCLDRAANLNTGIELADPEEVPNEITKETGLRRFYIGGVV